MPRSSVSAAIQELEERIGTRLLHRTTRKVSATEDGAIFYGRCTQLVDEVEDAESLFRRGAGPSGKLKVDVPGRIGRLIVAPALPEFLAHYPGIDVSLGVTDRAADLIEEGLDCVLRVGPLEDSGLISRKIGELPLINVASPTYLERYGRPQVPADLEAHWAVNYASPSTGRIENWEWVEQAAIHSMPMRARVTVNGAEAYIACCLAGLGLIQIPAYDVAAFLKSGDLVEVMPDHCAEPMVMTLLYPHRRNLSPRLQAFADWLEALLEQEILQN